MALQSKDNASSLGFGQNVDADGYIYSPLGPRMRLYLTNSKPSFSAEGYPALAIGVSTVRRMWIHGDSGSTWYDFGQS